MWLRFWTGWRQMAREKDGRRGEASHRADAPPHRDGLPSPSGVEFDILRLILDRVANRHAQAFGAAIERARRRPRSRVSPRPSQLAARSPRWCRQSAGTPAADARRGAGRSRWSTSGGVPNRTRRYVRIRNGRHVRVADLRDGPEGSENIGAGEPHQVERTGLPSVIGRFSFERSFEDSASL